MNTLQLYFHTNRLVEQEYHRHPLEWQGVLPAELRGVLFRNGNGRFVHQGTRYDHFFDGDGMITAFHFSETGVMYSNRHIQTREFRREAKAGKMRYRSFGTNLPGGFLRNAFKTRFKNAANTSVIWHGGKLLALWEGGWPHEIDPDTLETIGRYHYDGLLKNPFGIPDRFIFPEMAFSAHPKLDPDTGVLYNFGTVPGLRQRLVLYRIDPDGTGQIAHTINLPELIFTHDFVRTQTGKILFFLTPVSFDLLRMFLGLTPPVGSIKVRKDQPTRILVVDGTNVREYTTDFCFIFHYANGFETPDGKLIVDAFRMDDFPDAEANKALLEGDDAGTPTGILTRFTIDLHTGQTDSRPWHDYPGEFPDIHPDRAGADYRYVWSIGAPPDAPYRLLDGLLKTDLQTGRVAFKSFHPYLPGEPLFVPRPGATAEDDGWILLMLFDTDRIATSIRIFDAKDLTELGYAELPHNIPLGFHGTFVPDLQ